MDAVSFVVYWHVLLDWSSDKKIIRLNKNMLGWTCSIFFFVTVNVETLPVG